MKRKIKMRISILIVIYFQRQQARNSFYYMSCMYFVAIKNNANRKQNIQCSRLKILC